MKLIEEDIKLIIKMAHVPEPPFSRIAGIYGLSENEVVDIMKRHLSISQYQLWQYQRKRNAQKNNAVENFVGKLLSIFSPVKTA